MSSHEHHPGCGCGHHHEHAAVAPLKSFAMPAAIAKAIDLFRLGVTSGGVSMSASGGEVRLLKPVMPSLEFADMLKKASYERPAEERPTFDLRILLEEENGEIEGTVHRVTGLAAHTSMEDLTEVLFTFKTGSVDEAAAQLCHGLQAVVGDTELTVNQLFYRNSLFAEHDFDRNGKPVEKLSYSQRLSGNADQELSRFVADAVLKAIAWGNGQSKAKYVSVWFHPDGSEKPVYANIYPNPEGYKLLAHDQVVLPPKRNVLDRVYASPEELADAMARYVSRHHARKFKTLKVSFFHEQNLHVS